MEWSGSASLTQAEAAHRGEVACLDAAGARLATGGGDGALRLWRWAAGAGWQPAAEARTAHRYGAAALRWAAGGALLASGGGDGAVRLWGGALAARRALAAPGAAAVRALCWAGAGAGGARLLAGHADGALRVWAARGALLARLAPHDAALLALAAPGDLLLTACSDGVLKVFDLAAVCACGVAGEGGAAPAPLQWVDCAHDLGALCADAGAGGAATGGRDGLVRVWRRAAGGALRPAALAGHAGEVTALRWGGALLASASLDRSARLWAPAAGACLLVLPAHPRYLTCVALAPDLRYLITGSNDKTFRMWSLGSFTIDDELETPCPALAHFALGDLEGIGPVEEDEESSGADAGERGGDPEAGEEGAVLVWNEQAHSGAINCIATWDDLLATASSDGTVKVWRWAESAESAAGALEPLHRLQAHRYPALAADFGAGGAVLLTAGLDGCAFLWDVQSGALLRSLAVPGGGRGGGGGVRAARVSPHRPPQLLLATDDGLVPLWRLADPEPQPAHVYAGHAEAATCCAWSGDGRVAASGAASGELRLLAPPARACLHHDSRAHDLGVLSCDFAPPSDSIELPEGSYLLATAGCDSLVKLWRIDLQEDMASARVALVRQVCAGSGAVSGVRWGAGGAGGTGGAALVTCGAERWARVWRVALGGGAASVEQVGAAPAPAAGGAAAAALATRQGLLAVGSLAGELALWRLASAPPAPGDDDGAETALWGEDGVGRWLRDYIIDAPGSNMSPAAAEELESRVRASGLNGTRLLNDPIEDLLEVFGFEAESISDAGELQTKESAERSRARAELEWLRAPPPPPHVERAAPHALLCPMTHRLLRWPARAADGFTYERANLLEWIRAAPPEGAVSPVSGRRLRDTHVAPNYKLRDTLREFLSAAAAAAAPGDCAAADGSDG